MPVTIQPLLTRQARVREAAMVVPFFQERDEFEGSLLAGKYTITRKIGRGGMGAVYQATHILMDRVVAIKVVRANYANNDPICLQRFRLEAKASSCLSHPNVMTVYDFGITDDGIAYLVMDYIDGEGLDMVMRRDQYLTPQRAVSIFTQACHALAHAHDKGVVHRDLKPSNIMLVRDELGNEAVKIVDFGIAKMLPGRARSAEVLNDGGQVVGSPLYMSPEQCMNDDQDGRSDVYSLGCLLYETLAGFPPMQDKHVLGIMYKHLNEPARPFATTAPERRIPLALETVVLKALAKNPADRHQSMREFATELRRALESDADQQDASYVERPNAADDLIDECNAEPRHDAVPGSDPIEQHYLRKLRTAVDQHGAGNPDVVPFMHQLADYYISRSKPSRAERQLRNAVEVLVETYGPWDIRVAEAVLRLAELYRSVGRSYDAEPLYLDLLAIKRSSLGKNHPDIPFVMSRLAELYFSTARLDAAYKVYSQCLRIAESIFGPDDPVLSAIIIGLASTLTRMEKLDESAWLYHRALELNEYNLGPAHAAVIGPLIALGVVYHKLENWDEAERVLHRAINVHRENFDEDNTEIAHALWLLAEIFSHRDLQDDAEKLYEHVLKFFEAAQGDDDFIAQLYNNYGVHFVRNHQMERAEPQFVKALKIRERQYGRSSPQVASSLNLIATLYHSQMKLDLAENYYRRSLDACNGLPSAKDLASDNLRALGDLYTSQNRYEEAEPAYLKAIEVRRTDNPGDAPDAHTQQIIGSLQNLHEAANGSSALSDESEKIGSVE
jgi:serine/threonine protein kinase/Tfp pilus assembly protein PilF